MHALRQQQTISEPVQVSGFGYWSGQDVTIEFRPAPAGSGIVFVRRDLADSPRVAASVTNRIETPRRTTLAAQRGTVEMVEHVLAACAGLQVDNCEIWADQPEMPGCDGSSQPFAEALLAGGIVEQEVSRPKLIVGEVTRVGDEESWVEARPSQRPGLSVKYRLDYGSREVLCRQTYELDVTPESFCTELAAARTFLFQDEAEWLLGRGLGTRVTMSDLLVFGDEGPIENELRFEDECARHKALDLVGDLSLAGCDISGKIVAHRSGHRLNAELVRVLLAEHQVIEQRRKTA